MGRNPNDKQVNYRDDPEHIANIDRACVLLSWSRNSFLRAATRAYMQFALNRVAQFESSEYSHAEIQNARGQAGAE